MHLCTERQYYRLKREKALGSLPPSGVFALRLGESPRAMVKPSVDRLFSFPRSEQRPARSAALGHLVFRSASSLLTWAQWFHHADRVAVAAMETRIALRRRTVHQQSDPGQPTRPPTRRFGRGWRGHQGGVTVMDSWIRTVLSRLRQRSESRELAATDFCAVRSIGRAMKDLRGLPCNRVT